MAELSAGAGFDVSAPFERNMKFVGGKSVLDTGPASFEEGLDLAPLIEYEVQLDRILEKYPMIGEAATAAAGLVTFGVQEMIDGTKSAEQVFADFLNSIADMLLKTAQQMIAQYIAIAIARMFAGFGSAPQAGDFNLNGFGNLSPDAASGLTGFLNPLKFADGGRPPVGRPSIVGERGPELFVPGASGTIIPNEAMGGVNVGTINITVENTGEQLNPAAQKQLAGQVQGIVLSTLANERRSGGML
jgi:phage-related minor tail protein